jgi:hypothetical protein
MTRVLVALLLALSLCLAPFGCGGDGDDPTISDDVDQPGKDRLNTVKPRADGGVSEKDKRYVPKRGETPQTAPSSE